MSQSINNAPNHYTTERINRITGANSLLSEGSYEGCMAIYASELSQLRASNCDYHEDEAQLMDGRIVLTVKDANDVVVARMYSDDYSEALTWEYNIAEPGGHALKARAGKLDGFAQFRTQAIAAGALAGVKVFAYLDRSGAYWCRFQKADGQKVESNDAKTTTKALSNLLLALADLLPLPNFVDGAAA